MLSKNCFHTQHTACKSITVCFPYCSPNVGISLYVASSFLMLVCLQLILVQTFCYGYETQIQHVKKRKRNLIYKYVTFSHQKIDQQTSYCFEESSIIFYCKLFESGWKQLFNFLWFSSCSSHGEKKTNRSTIYNIIHGSYFYILSHVSAEKVCYVSVF